MTVLLISYDLNGHERPKAYAAVKKMIEEHSLSWARPLHSQWFVETTDAVSVWHSRMQSVTDSNDSWFICTVTRPHQGWLDGDVVKWLNARV